MVVLAHKDGKTYEYPDGTSGIAIKEDLGIPLTKLEKTLKVSSESASHQMGPTGIILSALDVNPFDYKKTTKEKLKDTINMGALGLGAITPHGKIASALTQGGIAGGAEFSKSKLSGESLPKSLVKGSLSGGEAAGMDLALGQTGKLLKGMGKIVPEGTGQFLKGKASDFISFVSDVPEKSTKLAIDKAAKGDTLFKNTPKQDTKLAEQVKNKVNDNVKRILNITGKLVENEKTSLRKSGGGNKIETFDIYHNTRDRLKNMSSVEGDIQISGKDKQIIDYFNNKLSTDKLSAHRANIIKNEINEEIPNTYNRLGEPTSTSQILGEMAGKLDDKIRVSSPKLWKANKTYVNAKEIQKGIDKINAEPGILQNEGDKLINAVRADGKLGAKLQELNDILPENKKFMGEVDDIIARKDFNSWMPGRGGGSGGPQGLKNLIRTAGFGTLVGGNTFGDPSLLANTVMTGMLLGSSPKINQFGLQGLSKGVNAAKGLPEAIGPLIKMIPQAATQMAQPLNNNLTTNPEWLEKIRKQRGL